MARLRSIPYEMGIATNRGVFDGLGFTTLTGSVTMDATKNYLGRGRASNKCTIGATTTSAAYVQHDPTLALGTTYYFRTYFSFSALPSQTCKIVHVPDESAVSLASVRMTTGGKLQLWNETGTPTQIGSDSDATLVANSGTTWYRVELKIFTNSGAVDVVELQLDGVSVASASGLSLSDAIVDLFNVGWVTSPGANISCWLDDGALNDSSGATNNSWCGPGKLLVSLPASDNSRTGFTAGAGGTTNLFDAVDNEPPTAVALASATNTSQIKDLANNTTDNYVANMQDYTTAGVLAADLVKLVQGVAMHGPDGALAMTLGLTIASNPAGSEATGSPGFAAAATTWDTNWRDIWTGASDYPDLLLGTQPSLKVRHGTASTTRTQMVASMAIVIEVLPVLPPTSSDILLPMSPTSALRT